VFVFIADTLDDEIHIPVDTRRETTPMTASPSSSASRLGRYENLPDSANKYDIHFFYSNLCCFY